ncbi:MAG: Smr/MutS family protein [Byssovorax sp.]
MSKQASRKKGEKGSKKGKGAEGTAPAEPFFRPFQKLAKGAGKKAKDVDAKDAKPAKPSPAKPSATKAPAAKPGPAKPAGAGKPGGAKGAVHAEPVRVAGADDPETFARFMAGVRPIEDKGKARIPASASRIEKGAAPSATVDLDAGARERMRALVTEGIRFETIDDGDRLDARRVDTDPRELRRLRRGQFAVDGRLDLHGHGVEEARRKVEDFVRKRSAEGDKVVAIIHGKGKHSPRQQGVLRGEIGAWLSQGRAARHVLAFATAPEEEGGEGALLVLLAR